MRNEACRASNRICAVLLEAVEAVFGELNHRGKLCVSVCPVGAIHGDGTFDFVSCYSHNYRERLGGFQDWIENVAESKNRADYRKRINDSETISMWQNVSIGAQTRCDRCMAVCPAGEEIYNYPQKLDRTLRWI